MSKSSDPLSRDLLRQILFEQHKGILSKPIGIPRESLSKIQKAIKVWLWAFNLNEKSELKP